MDDWVTAPERVTLDDRGVAAWLFDGPRHAPVVVAIHDFTANGLWFGDLARTGPPDWRLVSLDLRGRAASHHAAPPSSIADHIDDVVGLADLVGAGSCTILGHGTGAAIALACAAAHPDRIAAVLTLDGPPVPTRDPMLDWVHQAALVDPGATRIGVTYPERTTVIGDAIAAGRLPISGLTRPLRRAVDAEIIGSGFGWRSRLSATTLETDWSLLQAWNPPAMPALPIRQLQGAHGHRKDEPPLSLWDLEIERTVLDTTHTGMLVDPTATDVVSRSLAALTTRLPAGEAVDD